MGERWRCLAGSFPLADAKVLSLLPAGATDVRQLFAEGGQSDLRRNDGALLRPAVQQRVALGQRDALPIPGRTL